MRHRLAGTATIATIIVLGVLVMVPGAPAAAPGPAQGLELSSAQRAATLVDDAPQRGAGVQAQLPIGLALIGLGLLGLGAGALMRIRRAAPPGHPA